jgi:hypothetical protein
MILPREAARLLAALLPAFTQPTAARFATLLAAALLTTGPRAVANLLRTLGPLAGGTGPPTSGCSPVPRGWASAWAAPCPAWCWRGCCRTATPACESTKARHCDPVRYSRA